MKQWVPVRLVIAYAQHTPAQRTNSRYSVTRKYDVLILRSDTTGAVRPVASVLSRPHTQRSGRLCYRFVGELFRQTQYAFDQTEHATAVTLKNMCELPKERMEVERKGKKKIRKEGNMKDSKKDQCKALHDRYNSENELGVPLYCNRVKLIVAKPLAMRLGDRRQPNLQGASL